METPVIIINKNKLFKNIDKMSQLAKKRKVNIRPHIKTHKLPYIAKKQIESGAIGITVAKLSEAEVMASHGIDNIFIAYPIVTKSKIQKAIDLSKKIKLIVGVDSLVGAKILSELAIKNDITIEIRLEIDTGLARTGIPYASAVGVSKEIAKLPGVKISGIYTFRGPIIDGKPTLDIYRAGIEEGELMVKLAEEIENEGVIIEDISVGSTSTSDSAATIQGITEIRPGTYVFYDTMQEKYGCCIEEECAAKVQATVVSKPTKDRAIIDGGSKTFATDVQPNQPPIYLQGFGKIIGHPNITFEKVTEEHGMLHIEGESSVKIGDILEIIPNHICSTVNLHNFVYLENEDSTLDYYDIEARGKLQ